MIEALWRRTAARRLCAAPAEAFGIRQTAVSGMTVLDNDHFRADRNALVKINHVLIAHADTA